MIGVDNLDVINAKVIIMANLNRWGETPKEIYVVKTGNRHRVFWLKSSAKVYARNQLNAEIVVYKGDNNDVSKM